MRVFRVKSEECLYEKGKETAEHVLLYCDNTLQRAWSRGAQFRKLASEASGRRLDSEAADSRWKARPVQASEQASL